MYKNKTKIIAMVSLVIFNTFPHYNLFAMDASSKKNILFLLYANSERSSAFIPSSSENSHDGGTFYEALQDEIQQKNQKDKSIQTEIIPFEYAEQFDKNMDLKKIDYAFKLATEINNKIKDECQISILTNGEGLNIAALATQLLNSEKIDLDYNPKRLFLHTAQDLSDFKEKIKINRGFLTYQKETRFHNCVTKKITVINTNVDGSSQDEPLFNQDLMIVNKIHHVTPGNFTQTKEENENEYHTVAIPQISRWDKLKSCCKKTVADPRTKAIALLCLKIAIAAAIAVI